MCVCACVCVCVNMVQSLGQACISSVHILAGELHVVDGILMTTRQVRNAV